MGGCGLLQILTSDLLTSGSTAKVPLLQQKKLPLVAVGKHLCGVATGEWERRPLIGYLASSLIGPCDVQTWPCAACWAPRTRTTTRGSRPPNDTRPVRLQQQGPLVEEEEQGLLPLEKKTLSLEVLQRPLLEEKTVPPVRCWAWWWRCAATTAASGVTTWVRASSGSWASEPLTSPPSAACPAGPPAASDQPITAQQNQRTRPIREQRTRRRNMTWLRCLKL